MASNLPKAALRHRRCADQLAATKEEEEAGYLIGLAAECALKHHLLTINFHAKKSKRADTNPVYLHFPELRNELLAHGSGIIVAKVLTLISHESFFQGWTIKMRYAQQSSTPAVAKKFKTWRTQTQNLFEAVGL